TFHPFQCPICQSRFTRHENLKRHAAVHSRSQDEASLSCDICQAKFSRPDLRLRHLKRKHPDYELHRPKKRQDSTRVGDRGPRLQSSPSTSPTDTRGDYHLQDSGDEANVNATAQNWHSASPFDQNLPDAETLHNYQPRSLSLAASSLSDGTQIFGQLSPTQLVHPSSAGKLGISRASQGSSALEPSSLLLASILEPTTSAPARSDMTPLSQPSFDTNLANFNFDQWSPDPLLSLDGLSEIQDDWNPSAAQTARGIDLFFTYVSNFLPFLHRPTFEASQVARPLLLSMLCLAYQHGDDPDFGTEVGSGMTLSVLCFRRARTLIAAEEENVDEATRCVSMVQTYLLLQIFAMMYSCDNSSAFGLKTHSKMISLARASGLMQPLSTKATATEDLEALWRHFVQAESQKRTLFAVHQLDTLWYQFLSIPRSLSHLEIKHDLPCPEYYWTASSSGEWAHRQLIARQSGPAIQYQDAVRQILSSDSSIESLPAFDPYGAINITQFLLSSAREISGWSTMTGMLSMERLEPLRKSLLALDPIVHSKFTDQNDASHASLCEATWETAMIEMQMWSPSHTGGIVENNIDAALHQLIDLAPSCEFLCQSRLARSVQPHVDWFLRYLEETVVPDSEAPWITLYACKAFMIAWQLVKGGVEGAMQAVGVADGDAVAALAWAKKVFGRRERWKLGKTVMKCLEKL
ncbi:hypothetical protein IQ07DRAFT_463581, partial [Pyrenochaeta sp. DS3sAY3a]